MSMQPDLDERTDTEGSSGASAPRALPRKPWYHEYGKLAAAIAVFLVAGIALVLVFRNRGGDATGQSVPTATTVAVPSPTVAPTLPAPTATVVAAVPTAPAPTVTAPAVGTAFSVSVEQFTIPEGTGYLDIERSSWVPFGGTDENNVNTAPGLVYQDVGTEACWVSRPEAPVYRADGSTEESISTDISAPTLINPGDAYTVSSNLGMNCKNNTATRTLNLSGGVFSSAPGQPTGQPSGLDYRIVAVADVTGLPSGEATVTLERIVIEPSQTVDGGESAWRLIWAETGTLRVNVGGEDTDLTQGESVLVPAGIVYDIGNPSESSAAAIVFTIAPVQGDAPAAGSQAFTLSAQLAALPEGSDYLTIERMTWRSFGGTDENETLNGPALAYQDSGIWECFSAGNTFSVIRADGQIEPMSSDLSAPSTIPAGDGFLAPGVGGLNCKNPAQGDATSISLNVYRGGTTGGGGPLPGGVVQDVLTGAPLADLPAGPVMLTIQRVIVAAGESVPSLTGVDALVFIEDGGLNLRPATGDETVTRQLRSSSETVPAGGETDLQAGDGVALPAHSGAVLRNVSAEPVTVLVATVAPAP